MVSAVDPRVSKGKLDRDLATLRAHDLRRRGWWILEAEYPRVFVAFVHPRLRPRTIVLGVSFDFTDYDLRPPSVTFADPLTGEPYPANKMPTAMQRKRVVQLNEQLASEEISTLIQADPGGRPFLCLPGVREYHEHPAHTGDPWLTHRGTTAGSLYFLLEKISQYGVEPISGFNLAISIANFQQAEVPQ